jgi:hypothetical protein
MTIRYIFREDEPLRIKAAGKADPQIIGEALDEIAAGQGIGGLDPKPVVDAARSSNHPLHPHFEWDDAKAAESFRLDQARNLISLVRVVDAESKDGTSRAWQSIRGDAGVSYRHITEIKSSLDLQTALLRQADRELEAFQKRFRELTEVCDLVAQARKKVEARMQKFETRAAA